MARFFKKRDQLLGEVPGSLIFVGVQKIETPKIDIIRYNQKEYLERENISVEDIPSELNDDVCWINITGIHDSEFMRKIGDVFGIHNLTLEDIMNTAQRAKFEDFDDFKFTAIKMLKYDEKKEKVISEQLSVLIKDNAIITFQEEFGDVFDNVRNRIKKSKGRVRNEGKDYLYYILLDSVIENYVKITESLGEKIEELEMHLLESTSNEYLKSINNYKREMNFLAKVIKPAKELLLKYQKDALNSNNTIILPFIRDLQDLFSHTLESIETYRILLNDYLAVYHSNLNIKMNDIVRILTVFSAIFIPITFLAGVYGMNFENLPELHFKYSYFIFWGIVIIVTAILVFFFKHKKWL